MDDQPTFNKPKTAYLGLRLTIGEAQEIDELSRTMGTDRSKLVRWLIRQGMINLLTREQQSTIERKSRSFHISVEKEA